MKNSIQIHQKEIENWIFNMRGQQVMLNTNLAEMYGIETKVFNQAVKRKFERFPSEFRFQITDNEWDNLRSHFVTLKTNPSFRSQFVTVEDKRGKHLNYLPYVFTEQGVSMLLERIVMQFAKIEIYE